MGTYKLHELIKTEADAVELAQEVVKDMKRENSFSIRRSEWDEPSQALVYAAHQAMWRQTKTPDASRPPFTHRIEGLAFGPIVDRIAGGIFDKRHQREHLTRSIYSILSNNQLLVRVGRMVSPNEIMVHYIRAWPKGFTPKWHRYDETVWLSRRDEHDVQKQMDKAEELAGEVNSTYDISLIPLPDPTPDAILDYVRKVLPAAKAIQQERDTLAKEVRELREQLNLLEKDAYVGIVDEVRDILGSE